MTLRKGQPLPLLKPSTMRTVLSAVEDGYQYRRDIIKATGLMEGQVRAALHNLVFIRALKRVTDREGRSVYLTPGQWYEQEPSIPTFRGCVSECLMGVRSIFDVRIVRTDLPRQGCFTFIENSDHEHP